MSVIEWDESAKPTREELFDKRYFNGGGFVGGYQCNQYGQSYSDFPVHEITVNHVLARKPESVLEIGAARGYVLKRIQDAGIPATGLEISKHCWLTRAADPIHVADLCKPWPVPDKAHDLAVSCAVLEHIPEEFLPLVVSEMERTCHRGLHGIDFGGRDDGTDKTHVLLRDKNFWVSRLPKGHEVVDKEELERGPFPEAVAKGDGKLKLNVGCFLGQFHYGWKNIDVHDLAAFAAGNGYDYLRQDVRQGLQFGTGTVDLIFHSHFFEHLTYLEGLAFLRDCRRVIKPDGAMRIIVPDAELLAKYYVHQKNSDPDGWLSNFDEINDAAAESPTAAGKLWSLLFSGHSAAYDWETLKLALENSGWVPQLRAFRQGHPQILKETIDTFPCLSLYVEASPLLG